MLVKLAFFESLQAQCLPTNHLIYGLWVFKNGHFCQILFSKWISISSANMTSGIDFLHGGNLKSNLELLIRAVIMASQPQVGELYFSLLLGPFRPSSIAFEMLDLWRNCPASSPHLACTVVIYLETLFHSPNFTYSQRAWTKMTWLMLKQNSLKLLLLTTYYLLLTTYYLLLTTYYLLLTTY